jgi:O-antigen biosynthesis protein
MDDAHTQTEVRIVTLDWCAARSPWRMGVPIQALRRRGVDVREVDIDDDAALAEADVLWIYQPSSQPIVELIRTMRSRGVPVIVDVDDLLLPNALPMTARFARWWDPLVHRKRAEALVAAGLADHRTVESAPLNHALFHLQACIRLASAVTVSTRVLADAFGELNPNIYVLPNCYDDTNPLWDVSMPTRPLTQIGFLGTEHHGPNLDLIVTPLTRVLNAYPHVRVIEAGQGGLLDRLDAQPEQLVHLGWVPFETYPLLVHQVDIMLAPLVDEPFMRAKSNIRCMVAGLVGAAVIASPIEPYRAYVEHGVNGMLADSSEAWERALELLINDGDLRQSMGEANRQRARSYAISANIEKWMDVHDAVLRHHSCT